MNKKKNSKLNLRVDTVRTLQGAGLELVAGGAVRSERGECGPGTFKCQDPGGCSDILKTESAQTQGNC